MLFEGNLPRLFHLLKPRQAPAVRVEGGDDVGDAITIHIRGEHLSAALIGELKLMTNPFTIPVCRLLVPAFVENQIRTPIVIDVANTFAVIKC